MLRGLSILMFRTFIVSFSSLEVGGGVGGGGGGVNQASNRQWHHALA